MATPTSPNVIQQLIDNAMENEQSLVQWLGNGGLEQVLSALNQNIVYRGIMAFSTSSSMALSGGGDSQYAICLNDGVGLNFYKYFPNVDNTVLGAITSAEGGQWRPIFASQDIFEGYWKYSLSKLTPRADIRGTARILLGESDSTDVWIDMPATNGSGVAHGMRLSPMTTTVMNSMITPSDWMVITNTTSRMLLLQHPSLGFKSAGVYANKVTSGIVSASAITITIPAQFVNSYKVLLTATDHATATAFAGGYYISAKATDTFTISFVSFTTGTINFDYQISH